MESLHWEIAETAHAIRRAFDQKAARVGVTRAQWRVLAWLKRIPGQRQVELADRLDVEPITLCRIVDRLEEAGLVQRRRDPADRRAWKLFLTEAAEPLIHKLHGLADEMTAEAFEGFSPEQIEALGGALGNVRANLASNNKGKRVTA